MKGGGTILAAGMMLLAATVLTAAGSAAARNEYGARLGRRELGQPVFHSAGTSIRTDVLYPSLRKWYLPQELAPEYKTQWEYANYREEIYQRYLDPSQEGIYFYDLYGRQLKRGWLVYDWRQTQPATFGGSGILQAENYSGFGHLVVTHDSRGQHHVSVMIGDEIHATLTPMTFRKTAYNGLMFNYGSERMAATMLISRISLPLVGTPRFPIYHWVDNFTNLIGLRATWDVTESVKIGGTVVNVHNGRSGSDRFEGNPFTGKLTTAQLDGRIDRIALRLSGDSPEDGKGGPTLFASDVEIWTKMGQVDTVLVGSDIGFAPRIEGGLERDGFLVAEGRGETSRILLEYIFSEEDPDVVDLESIIPDADLVNNIERVRFRLTLGNDYKVEVTSNKQTDNNPLGEQPQFRTVARASGNVKDNSNQRVVVFDYGLPTATQVIGLTLEASDIAGFRFNGEFNVNHQFTQYPNRKRDTHRTSSGIGGDRTSTGWMVNVSRRFHPFFFFGEAFGMDADYDTSSRFVDGAGNVDYSDSEPARSRHTYDFVDDNDDNDRKNDQKRRFDDGRTGDERQRGRTPEGFADEAVFPGLDENNDFIPDFNQNSLPNRPNFLPDFEEPFLRYSVDRPEYLFALDLNNNGWGDRFENDDEPDYPYKRDRRGHNAYLRAWISPELRVTAGHERVRRPSTGERNRTTYGIVAYEQSLPRLGNITFYDVVKLVKDDIADDLIQWVPGRVVLGTPPGSPGLMKDIRDPLVMQNTFANRVSLGFERFGDAGINTENKVMFEFFRQRDRGMTDRDGREISRNTRRFGLINKLEYVYRIGRVAFKPRFKHELFMDDTPYSIVKLLEDPKAERAEWTGIFSTRVEVPLLRRSVIQVGLERLMFRDLEQEEVSAAERASGLDPGDATGDYRETSVALQLSNSTQYVGYNLMVQIGLRVDRRRIEVFAGRDRSQTLAFTFLTFHAGLGAG